MRSVVLIPARFASSRYPGKPLVALLGKPLVLWVAELSARAVGHSNVYVLTDDKRISDVVESAGFQTVMTSSDALTGTDRLAEAVALIEADIYVNVQGDEPLVAPSDIIKVINVKKSHRDCVVNCYCWITDQEDPNSLNIPKVVTTEDDRMVYMSRCALPGFKDTKNAPSRYKKQVCVYGFTHDELTAFHGFGRKSTLEYSEDIEILRFLELGKQVQMIEVQGGSLAVDVPEDVAPVEEALRRMHDL